MLRTTLAAFLATLALSSAARASTLWVGPLGPDTAPCTDAQLLAAIHAHRPAADLRTGAAPAPDDVSAAVQQEGGQWVLTARGRPEARALRRELPLPGKDCAALSETAALMLDRYLDDIEWKGDRAVIEPLARPRPAASPSPIRVAAGVGLGVELATSGLAPMLQIDVGLRRGQYALALSGAGSLPAHQAIAADPSVGRFDAQSASVQLAAGRRFPAGRGAIQLGVAPGLEWLWVRTEGPRLFHTQTGSLARPYLGAQLSYEVPLAFGLVGAVRAQARGLLRSGRFEVEGYAQPMETRPFEGDLALALARIFP